MHGQNTYGHLVSIVYHAERHHCGWKFVFLDRISLICGSLGTLRAHLSEIFQNDNDASSYRY